MPEPGVQRLTGINSEATWANTQSVMAKTLVAILCQVSAGDCHRFGDSFVIGGSRKTKTLRFPAGRETRSTKQYAV